MHALMIRQITTNIAPPIRFTYPMCYTPHPLARMACERLMADMTHEPFAGSLWREGKMFGVLVVGDDSGVCGYLAAYSGQILGRYDWQGFVPPIYDLTVPDGEFKRKETEISSINNRVKALENGKRFTDIRNAICQIEDERQRVVAEFRQRMAKAKQSRDEKRRRGNLTDEEKTTMAHESQYMKAELRRITHSFDERMKPLKEEERAMEDEIATLKKKRKTMSDNLQRWLFEQYHVLNALGESRTVTDIFSEYAHCMPPSGTGECCAPKLLQYAYSHHLRPLCMAEFWYGAPPRMELRRHGCYYPACRSKCKPLMAHMLIGLDVDPDPIATSEVEHHIDIVYDDDCIVVVNKPSGMLSVPGKGSAESVYSETKRLFSDAKGPLIVHRLDMDTSGLMVIAKTKEAHQELQEQFVKHDIRKTYVALLDGLLPTDTPRHGTISIPLRPDIDDRPRQMVDFVHGKRAITSYEVISEQSGQTLIALHPMTGRTHQLRVHCAHPEGLNTPIVGDRLYGKSSERLCLHAQRITFRHPVTGKQMTFNTPMPRFTGQKEQYDK